MKFLTKAQRIVASKKAEGYIDVVVKVIIAVVIGLLVMTGLYFLIDKVALPAAKDRTSSMFAEEYEVSIAG